METTGQVLLEIDKMASGIATTALQATMTHAPMVGLLKIAPVPRSRDGETIDRDPTEVHAPIAPCRLKAALPKRVVRIDLMSHPKAL
jgi:hypothetical protein